MEGSINPFEANAEWEEEEPLQRSSTSPPQAGLYGGDQVPAEHEHPQPEQAGMVSSLHHHHWPTGFLRAPGPVGVDSSAPPSSAMAESQAHSLLAIEAALHLPFQRPTPSHTHLKPFADFRQEEPQQFAGQDPQGSLLDRVETITATGLPGLTTAASQAEPLHHLYTLLSTAAATLREQGFVSSQPKALASNPAASGAMSNSAVPLQASIQHRSMVETDLNTRPFVRRRMEDSQQHGGMGNLHAFGSVTARAGDHRDLLLPRGFDLGSSRGVMDISEQALLLTSFRSHELASPRPAILGNNASRRGRRPGAPGLPDSTPPSLLPQGHLGLLGVTLSDPATCTQGVIGSPLLVAQLAPWGPDPRVLEALGRGECHDGLPGLEPGPGTVPVPGPSNVHDQQRTLLPARSLPAPSRRGIVIPAGGTSKIISALLPDLNDHTCVGEGSISLSRPSAGVAEARGSWEHARPLADSNHAGASAWQSRRSVDTALQHSRPAERRAAGHQQPSSQLPPHGEEEAAQVASDSGGQGGPSEDPQAVPCEPEALAAAGHAFSSIEALKRHLEVFKQPLQKDCGNASGQAPASPRGARVSGQVQEEKFRRRLLADLNFPLQEPLAHSPRYPVTGQAAADMPGVLLKEDLLTLQPAASEKDNLLSAHSAAKECSHLEFYGVPGEQVSQNRAFAVAGAGQGLPQNTSGVQVEQGGSLLWNQGAGAGASGEPRSTLALALQDHLPTSQQPQLGNESLLSVEAGQAPDASLSVSRHLHDEDDPDQSGKGGDLWNTDLRL